jgi:hypothetical protein
MLNQGTSYSIESNLKKQIAAQASYATVQEIPGALRDQTCISKIQNQMLLKYQVSTARLEPSSDDWLS